MNNGIQYKISTKEHFYFVLKIIFATIGYGIIFIGFKALISSDQFPAFIPILFYAVLIVLYLFFRLGLLIGYIQGNAIKVSKNQFSNLYSILESQCKSLGIENVPDMYIMQNGGILNAFATAFMGSNYIVLYSEIVEEAYQNNIDTVGFVIGHELGHIKRKHVLKTLILFPSIIVPFLNSAYSRACEYTCDNIGAALSPNGAKSGLLLLAAGKGIWKKVNVEKFIEQELTEGGFWCWFAEKVSSHPKLTKRLIQFNNLIVTKPLKQNLEVIAEPIEIKASDHNRFLPNA